MRRWTGWGDHCGPPYARSNVNCAATSSTSSSSKKICISLLNIFRALYTTLQNKRACVTHFHVFARSLYIFNMRASGLNLVIKIQNFATRRLSKTVATGCICARVALFRSSFVLCALPGLLTPQQLAQVSTRVQSWIWHCFMGCFCPCIVLQILALLSALHRPRSMVLPS